MASDHPEPTEQATAAPTDGAGSLIRLRETIERAATTIERLQSENARLAARVSELSDEPFLSGADLPGQRPNLFTDEPAELRSRIESFIEALDRVLAERAQAPGSR